MEQWKGDVKSMASETQKHAADEEGSHCGTHPPIPQKGAANPWDYFGSAPRNDGVAGLLRKRPLPRFHELGPVFPHAGIDPRAQLDELLSGRRLVGGLPGKIGKGAPELE